MMLCSEPILHALVALEQVRTLAEEELVHVFGSVGEALHIVAVIDCEVQFVFLLVLEDEHVALGELEDFAGLLLQIGLYFLVWLLQGDHVDLAPRPKIWNRPYVRHVEQEDAEVGDDSLLFVPDVC